MCAGAIISVVQHLAPLRYIYDEKSVLKVTTFIDVIKAPRGQKTKHPLANSLNPFRMLVYQSQQFRTVCTGC
jgi:hypothetical protein